MRSRRSTGGAWQKRLTAALVAAGLALTAAPAIATGQDADFAAWLDAVKREAASKGISAATIKGALSGLTPIERVIELDRRQPEFTLTFWDYLDRLVSPTRITQGRRLLAEHRPLFDEVTRRYGVPGRFLVAFWGVESNFGERTGGFPVIRALATLAFDDRRAAFFRAQLFAALRIIDGGHIAPKDMMGSWAGAMGQVQFIPTTFLDHAVDFDGDRRRDIWTNRADALGSAANYLRALGWRTGETWGREVRLPDGFDWNLATGDVRKPLTEWQRLGVRRADGGDLPSVDIAGAILVPAGHRGPAFLVYRNFSAIMDWNRSLLYAIAVGHLADRLIGKAGLVAQRPADEERLSRAQVQELQGLLVALGYNPGAPDGVVGSQTRAALRAYQRQAKLAADGYPTPQILEGLRRDARAPATN